MKFSGCIQSFMLPWKLQKRQILPVNHNLLSLYFSPAKFQPVSCNLSLAMIWQMTYTHKLPKLCSATLSVVKPRTKSPVNLPKMRKHRKWFPEIVAVGNIVLCLFEFICHPHFLLLAKIIVSSFCLLISKVNNRLSFPSNSF